MKRLIAIAAAGGLLLVGAFALVSVTSPSNAEAQTKTVSDDDVEARWESRLERFLDRLVEDGVITVNEAKRLLRETVELPPGYAITWSGQFEQMIEARERLAEAEAKLVLKVQSLAGETTLEIFNIEGEPFIYSSEYRLFFRLSDYDYDRFTGIDARLLEEVSG